MSDIIIDTWCQAKCTLGVMIAKGFHCFTLELPWKDNENDVSCIPAGTYKYTKYFSPHLQHEVLLLHDVPGREMTEVHFGNYTRDIEGCILTGESITFLDRDDIPDVTNSKATLQKLLDTVPDSGTIQINRVISDFAPTTTGENQA